MQKRFDWIVGEWPRYDGVNEGVSPFSADWQTSNTLAFHLIDADDLAAKNDRLRVERVIGQVFMSHQVIEQTGPLPDDACVFIHERIYVYDAGGNGAVVPGAAQDLSNVDAFADADRSFLWHRTRVIGVGNLGLDAPAVMVNCNQIDNISNAVDSSLGYSGIDVRVKRVLTGRQILIYQVQWDPFVGVLAGGADSNFDSRLNVWAFLRVGVKF